ncbi:uncharacterized protein SAPINGB_P001877 [Magnusiomyces paraingens]|uniref:Major facilitator superfamily (MFS) profile domain-containing protein n=1 Tax=Magnusiomyces paraingens TaxID=2606893 RepID=A0A5E8BD61_9ASCO|nr:uncharacterized protein SAPINGB_P001877 [Saprochaete ingens]VVT48638.1 unnamed protein product [Saprochaete ingens]
MKLSIEESARLKDPVYLLNIKYSLAEESRLVRKFDLHLMTFLCALYLVSYLDRSNIGNANVAGLSRSLDMSDHQYQWLLTVFYLGYILFQWLTLFWKRFPPKYYVCIVVVAWGLVSTGQAIANTWVQMMALRLLLGIFEAGFGPGVPYYLSFFYYRHEIAFRTGLFLVVPPVSSAFSGALAYFITKHMQTDPWRLLYLVEGLPTIFLGVLCYWCIPNDSKSARGLTPHEREIAAARSLRQIGTIERVHKIDWNEGLASLVDVKNLCCMAMFFCINVSFASLPIYLPTIIRDMKHSNASAQGLTAPPYLVAAIATLTVTYLSDKLQQRGYFVAGAYLVAATGYMVLATVDIEHTGIRYAATFLCCAGVYPCVGVLLSWLGNMHGDDNKRSFAYVLLQLVGQCGPLVGTRVYPATDTPRYTRGFWTCAGCLAASAALALWLRAHLAKLNRIRDNVYGPLVENAIEMVDSGEEDDDNGFEEDYNGTCGAGLEQESHRSFRYIL